MNGLGRSGDAGSTGDLVVCSCLLIRDGTLADVLALFSLPVKRVSLCMSSVGNAGGIMEKPDEFELDESDPDRGSGVSSDRPFLIGVFSFLCLGGVKVI